MEHLEVIRVVYVYTIVKYFHKPGFESLLFQGLSVEFFIGRAVQRHAAHWQVRF